jgi:hypothetical protein
MFPRAFLSGDDLAGRTWTVIIASVSREMLRVTPTSTPQEKYVLHIEDARKALVLNRTIAQQIATILGSEDTDEWTGKKIALHPVAISVAGKNRLAIRATAPVNGTAVPPAAKADDEAEDV